MTTLRRQVISTPESRSDCTTPVRRSTTGWSVEQAYQAWDEWESVLKGFAEGYGLDSLYELMAIADPLTPEERGPTKPLAPLDREALSQAMDWLKAYVVYYLGADLEDGFGDDTVSFA